MLASPRLFLAQLREPLAGLVSDGLQNRVSVIPPADDLRVRLPRPRSLAEPLVHFAELELHPARHLDDVAQVEAFEDPSRLGEVAGRVVSLRQLQPQLLRQPAGPAAAAGQQSNAL